MAIEIQSGSFCIPDAIYTQYHLNGIMLETVSEERDLT
jgi:hypothetical protein